MPEREVFVITAGEPTTTCASCGLELEPGEEVCVSVLGTAHVKCEGGLGEDGADDVAEAIARGDMCVHGVGFDEHCWDCEPDNDFDDDEDENG